MWYIRTAAFAVGLGYGLLAGTASAQIDYRNLDDERPVTTEDAYPIERYASELLVSYSFTRERGGQETHLFPLELAYGALGNTQIGLKAPVAGIDRDAGAGTDWGLAGLGVFGLYNFNTESPVLPALSLRGDVGVPVGSLAGDAARFSLKAIATRSWGRSRFHLNALWSFGPEDELAEAEATPRWSYSLAVDRTLYRESLLFVGEVVAARAVSEAEVEVNAAVGARYQWSPTFVVDVGVTRRLRDDVGPDFAITVGLSHVFGFGWLSPSRVR